ncbi:MAG: leucine-rich repeat protein [Verrucomicrobia bacterium]|nr:leucine-rich repeat protein [Verrucomicrobiota bacterium]
MILVSFWPPRQLHAIAIVSLFLIANLQAQLPIPSLGAVNETFDTLGGNLTLPSYWRISNGPYFGNPIWSTANTSVQLSAQSGSPTIGGTYNWGSSNGTNRAIGPLISQAGETSLILRLKNTSNSTIESFAVGFVVKQFYFANWGIGGDVTFFHSRNGSSWTQVPQLKTVLTATSSNQTHFFNNPPTFSVPATTFSIPPLEPNAEIYFRWSLAAVSTSAGYGIDDIWITPVASSQPTSDFSFTSVGSGQIQITGYSGTASSVAIPSSIGGNSVVSIGANAFAGKTGITLVEIPDSVRQIEFGAFSNCTNLSRVTLPFGVQKIDNYTFQNCTKLTSITIPASVASIGNWAFAGCIALSNVNILYGLNSIGSEAFIGCISLQDLVVPGSVSDIGFRAFYDCSNLKSVWISYGVKSIQSEAFKNCRSLSSLTLGNTLEFIGNEVFYGCHNLPAVTIPPNVRTLGYKPFFDCQSLSAIHVHAANPVFSSLDGVLFNKNQTRLVQFPIARGGEYSIPASVQEIAEFAFYDCSALSVLIIPPNVRSVGKYAFEYCSGLYFVVLPRYLSFSNRSSDLHLMRYELENGVISIVDCEGYGMPQVNALEIPSEVGGVPVTKIAYGAFRSNNLLSIRIPSSIQSIEDHAFYNCNSLNSLTIPYGVKAIGRYAFSGCPITTLTIPASVESIEEYAFSSCSQLRNLTIESGLLVLGSFAFRGCYNLSTVTIPSSTKQIGTGVFAYCGSLVSIGVHAENSNFSSVDGALFSKDGSVLLQFPPGKLSASYAIPGNVVEIGAYAFAGSWSLANLIVPASVRTIGEDVFNATGLSGILFKGTPPDSPGWLQTGAVLYRLAGQTGWEPTFAGLPVQVFQPQAAGGFDHSAGFHFYFTGSGGMPMNIERSTSLEGEWEVVSTNNSSGYFLDANPPAGRAFYRAVVP